MYILARPLVCLYHSFSSTGTMHFPIKNCKTFLHVDNTLYLLIIVLCIFLGMRLTAVSPGCHARYSS